MDELPEVKELLNKINSQFEENKLDTCVISCLRSSSSTVRIHADDEPGTIDQFSPICNVSLGLNRRIEFIDKANPGSDPVFSYDLTNGSLLTMNKGCQQALKHRIRKNNVFSEDPRFCLSFRKASIPCVNNGPSPVINNVEITPCSEQSDTLITTPDVIITHDFLDDNDTSLLLDSVRPLQFDPIGARAIFYAGTQDYQYAGVTHTAQEIPPSIKSIIGKLSCPNDAIVNSVLVTKYKDGADFIPAHADDEEVICPWSKIYTLSLGGNKKNVF